MQTRIAFIFAAFIFCLTIGCRSDRADAPPPVGLNSDQPGTVDSIFASETLADGTREIELSRLALNRGENLDVKLLAQQILDDRTRADKELRMISRFEKVPVAESNSSTKETDELSSLSGEKFDRGYLRHIRNLHRDEIKKCRAAARNAYNDELRSFAGRLLASLEEHVRMAENINQLAQFKNDVNEPAGAERSTQDIDPYYLGDPNLRHQLNPENTQPTDKESSEQEPPR